MGTGRTVADALEGIRVLDCTQAMAGPYAALQLRNMGAEVIKIEPPQGDGTRQWGPFVGEHSMAFLAVNCGKKSVVFNLKDPNDATLFKELIKTADVLVESFRTGTMARLGLDYDSVKALNPGLVYCSISGYGHTGPYADLGGYDLIAQGYTGIMSVTGEPERPPVKAGIPITDLGTALFAVQGILAALLHRAKTGEGQFIDTSLYDAGVALSVWEAHSYFANSQVPEPLGSAHRLLAPYQAFRASDGYFTVGAGPQNLWERFCHVMGLTVLLDKLNYATAPKRLANRESLEQEIEQVTRTKPRAHWLQLLLEAGIPAGPIHNYREVFSDPHTEARGLVSEVNLQGVGTVKTLGSAIKMSRTQPQVREGVPSVGEHTEEILADLKSLLGSKHG